MKSKQLFGLLYSSLTTCAFTDMVNAVNFRVYTLRYCGAALQKGKNVEKSDAPFKMISIYITDCP